MKLLSTPEVLAWTKVRGIAEDSRYPRSHTLVYTDRDAVERRFWKMPQNVDEIAPSAEELLTALGSWHECLFYPGNGRWPRHINPPEHLATAPWAPASHSYFIYEHIWLEIVKGLGVPSDHEGGVILSPHERDILLTLVFSQIAFGRRSSRGAYIIPDHARVLVDFDQDHELVAEFLDPAAATSFASALSAWEADVYE